MEFELSYTNKEITPWGGMVLALRRGLIKRGAIVHTDRSSQYVSNVYRELLGLHDIRQSMSGKGDCYDKRPGGKFLFTL
jgi:transposase InsO family protein